MVSNQELEQKKTQYVELNKLIQLHATKKLPPFQAQTVTNEQYKLEFRLMELESLCWDAKLESAKKVLRTLQSVK
jgi:aspartyl-tRNA synthetase